MAASIMMKGNYMVRALETHEHPQAADRQKKDSSIS